MKSQRIQILDCTIRDGSYLINYQFTAEDTFVIAHALSRAGIRRIEVGHGIGLYAQYTGKGSAAQSDTEYIRAAKDAVGEQAQVGCFFIPGIGSLGSIREAADAGLDFIRVGTNIVDYREAEEPIRLARSLGLEVWSNLMKSYLVTPEEFARIGAEVAGFGAQVVVLVDSAGGFTPDDIQHYLEAAYGRIPAPLGFHGHNNLQLVIANCLAFARGGGSYLDASLRGMGRSAGNAATELLCALLAREGYDLGGIDWRRLMRIAQEMIAPIMPRDIGLLPAEIASGLNFFHSSFMPVVEEQSQQAGVAPYETILELPADERKVVSPDTARWAAREARRKRSPRPSPPPRGRWIYRTACGTLEELKRALRVLASKTGVEAVVTLARPRDGLVGEVRIAPLRAGRHYCIAHVESPGPETDEMIAALFAGEVRLWMGDRRIGRPAALDEQCVWLTYDDDRLIASALCDFLAMRKVVGPVWLPAGRDRLVSLIEAMIGRVQGAEEPFAAAVAASTSAPLSAADITRLAPGGMVVTVVPGAMDASATAEARKRGMEIWRLDLQEALTAEVSWVFDSYRRYREHAGRRRFNGFDVVAGGIVGEAGDIVVDSISTPTTILGKADGRGGLLPLRPEDEQRRRTVLEWMLQREAD